VAFALYSINCLVFITGMDCVYCAVQTGYLNKRDHNFNPLNAELNPICHLLALLGGATIVVVSRLRVKFTYPVVFSYFIVVLMVVFIN
jgi:hypothetical protein